MKQVILFMLSVSLFCVEVVQAASHVGVGLSHYEFLFQGHPGSGSSLSGFAGELDSFHQEQSTLTGYEKNSFSYRVQTISPYRDRLTIDIDVNSAFRPEFSGVDRFGRPFTVPDTFFDTTFDSRLAIRLPTAARAELHIPGTTLNGTPAFELSYFDGTARYGTDLGTRALTPGTNFMAVAGTLNEVFDFNDQRALTAGTHLLIINVDSALGANNQLLNGQAQIVLDFVVPEPGTGLMALGLGLLMCGRPVSKSDRG